MAAKTDHKILVSCPNWVGDVVMATPALETIRENNPRAHIAVMVRPHLEPVIAGLPYYDEIISYDSKTRHRSVKAKLRLSR
ncbi:MAG: lipopolysaccharide heptosyltransferase II, partial [Deltaproteobacteria bacterium]|nr:lipopolysaccharide heptosyltransferase II [Deltaproteobacteria bacterium]